MNKEQWNKYMKEYYSRPGPKAKRKAYDKQRYSREKSKLSAYSNEYGKRRYAKYRQHRLDLNMLIRERPDYKNFWYCGKCYKNIPKNTFKCPHCQRVRFIRKRSISHANLELPRY